MSDLTWVNIMDNSKGENEKMHDTQSEDQNHQYLCSTLMYTQQLQHLIVIAAAHITPMSITINII
jgi:hypothetical protein